MVAPETIATKSLSAPEQTGLHWYWQLAVVCAAIALVFSRQPDAFSHAQFFAEDGSIWFADAYNSGWFTSLFKAQDGYFQTLPRLAAALSLLAPLPLSPLVMNLAGLLIQILPVPLLLSSRLSTWGSLSLRATLAFTYLVMPNCSEMNVTIGQAQWHLALVACLLLLGSAPTNRAWKAFDITVFILCGLTGPFAVLLVPIAGLRLWPQRDRSKVLPLCILSGTAAIQGYALLTMHRDHWPLGASLKQLIRILSGQVFLATILGSNGLGTHDVMPFLGCVVIAGSLLMGYCFLNANAEWKLFLLFSAMVFAASLSNPVAPELRPGPTAWGFLTEVSGIRYWFFPTLAFTWTIVWYLLGRPHRRLSRAIGATLMALMLTGIVRDWRIPPRKDVHFASYVDKFEASPPGTVMFIPENPVGWTVRLVKR
jgi:hypothetical protein